MGESEGVREDGRAHGGTQNSDCGVPGRSSSEEVELGVLGSSFGGDIRVDLGLREF